MMRGFLFSLDAILAALILIGGLVLVTSINDRTTDTTQLASASQDTLAALQGVRMSEIGDPWILGLLANGTIQDENVTVLEQIGFFWALNDDASARRLAELFLNGTDERYAVRLLIDDDVLYERNGTGNATVATATRLITGIAQGQAVKGSSASAYLRKIKDKRSFVLIPFGGFVGEGNISVQTDLLPSDANITDVIIEVDTDQAFMFRINGAACDYLAPGPGVLEPSTWNRTNCTGLVTPGSTNTFSLNSSTVNGSFVAGGFVKVVYITDQFSGEDIAEPIYRFPSIDGLVNLFDGFYVDGDIHSINVSLHFISNYTTYLTIGNASWSFVGSEFEQQIALNESTIQDGLISAGLSFENLSGRTIPLRFGIGSVVITGAPSDTMLVLDTSGSMTWCTNQTENECFQACGCAPGCASGGGTCGSTNCGIYSTCALGDVKKIAAAQNASKGFVDVLLNGTDITLGLVEFGNGVKSYFDLTTNATALKNEIDTYTANGGTCICCGVNKAVELINAAGQGLIIPRKSSGWKYNDQNLASPPTNWTNLTYNDGAWRSGTTGIGWSYADLNTIVGGSRRYQGDYFYRRIFNVTNASDVRNLSLYVRSDDGARVYLNNVQIDNDYPNQHAALYWNRNNITVNPALLVNGQNVIAIRQYHRGTGTSPMAFDLELTATYSSTASQTKTKNVVVMTDGQANGECNEQNTGSATQDAIQASCDAYDNYGINVYTVGFGKDADIATLQSMASCANGAYYSASNATQLTEVFDTIAGAIIDYSSTQRAIIEGTITPTRLYGDSVIQANYTPYTSPPQPNEIAIAVQTDQLSNCTSTVELHEGSRFVDALITSYSGDYWTDRLVVNGVPVYNLSAYADIYASIGDPYRIMIPPSVLVDGNNTVELSISTDALNASVNCSLNNTVVYTIAINLSTERSDAVPFSEGCRWNVEVNDGSILNLTIPASYAGANLCAFNSTNISYNAQDAYQLGAYTIFSRLDFRDEGRIEVNLNEEDLEVIVTTISGVPYLWGPAVARVEVSG